MGVDNSQSQPLLRFRRIVSMEIVRVPTKSGSTLPEISPPQRKSEERQLRLLRRSFREHDLYFVPPSHGSGPIIAADITHPLQRSFANAISNEDNPSGLIRTQWWHSIAHANNDGSADGALYRPDSRFFWNEEHLKSLLPPIANNFRVEDSPHALLLDWTFPVTSAFLGFREKIKPVQILARGNNRSVLSQLFYMMNY